MLVLIQFACQQRQTIAEINFQIDKVVLKTKPQKFHNQDEIEACQIQSGKTAFYNVFIGNNTFRSSFIVYDAFKLAQIDLQPTYGSSIEAASNYFIASYQIQFLENELEQHGTIGQLLTIIYDLNECFYNHSIFYETFEFIQPIIKTNPKCKMSPTDIILYSLSLEDKKLYQGYVSNVDFKLKNLVFIKLDCTTGTIHQQENCKKASQVASSSNVANFTIDINFPNTITSRNNFIDLYGNHDAEDNTYNFVLNYNFQIFKRETSENCTQHDKVSFLNNIILIQQEEFQLCDLSDTYRQTFWIIVIQQGESNKQLFQLQFYTNQYFKINQFLDCSTWEISNFKSLNECQSALQNLKNQDSNLLVTIMYKLFDSSNVYLGSYIFDAQYSIQTGTKLQILHNQVCITKLKITTTKNIIRIEIKISTSFYKFQANKLDFHLVDNFQKQKNDLYCFQIDTNQELQLNELSFKQPFGIVLIDDQPYEIEEILPLLRYQFFWEGYVFTAGALLIMLIWACAKRKIESIKQIIYGSFQ